MEAAIFALILIVGVLNVAIGIGTALVIFKIARRK